MAKSSRPIRARSRVTRAAQGVVKDETARKAILELQTVLDAVPVAMLVVDGNGRIVHVNAEAERLFGYARGSLAGQPVEILVPEGLRAIHARHLHAFMAEPRPRPMNAGLTLSGRRKDGRPVPLKIALNPMPAAGGAGVVAVIYDMSSHQNAEITLREAMRRVEEANRAKSEFLRAASHDLRQPLQTIALLQSILQRKATNEELRRIVADLGATLATMTDTINSLLNISQLETGALAPAIAEFSVAQLIARMKSEFAMLAESRGLQLRIVGSTAVVRSDPRLLERIVQNLMSNAVKYTRRGRILLGCRRQGAKLRIEVWDSGIGMAENERQAILQQGYRTPGGSAAAPGLGLGLWIVHRLAAILGHDLDVRSKPGKGSVFAVAVPLLEPTPRSTVAHVADRGTTGAKPTILVVVDDETTRGALRQLLEVRGSKVIAAASAADAIAAGRGGGAPDLIIADLEPSPESGGASLLPLLRREWDRAVPAIVLDGGAPEQSWAETAADGIAYLSKPIAADVLLSTVQNLLGARLSQPRQPMAAPSKAADLATAKARETIFVVDDEPGIRSALRRLLESEGYAVQTFADTAAFLEAPREPGRGCLLLDIGLRGMSGLELQQLLKSRGDSIPVIIVTAAADVSMAVGAMRSGAVDFLTKPVDAAELVGSVARAINLGREVTDKSHQAATLRTLYERLTVREREIMSMIVQGHANKEIAARLSISQRTVEDHRARVMRKMRARSLADLVRSDIAIAPVDAE